jgi:hypothetical protein
VVNAEWREKNADRRREYHAQGRFREARRLYKKANPEVVNLYNAKRRARKYGSMAELSPDERSRIDAIYRQRDVVSEWTGLKYEVDHIIPLARGGTHHPDNLQLLTEAENRSKGASSAPKVGVSSAILFQLV